MPCESKIIIKNPYNDKIMRVPCRHCESCLISSANEKLLYLKKYLGRWKYVYMVTLTYDNKHIPFVQNRSNLVLRNALSFGDNEILMEMEKPYYFKDLDYKKPINGSIYGSSAIGVLYYPDLQKFFKRLRKNYGKEFNFKYFALSEYGTTSRRPHFHVLFMSDRLERTQLETAVTKTWSLCDWSKLDLSAAIERCGNNISGYVTSYLTSLSNCDGLLSDKMFRQKTTRSKDLDFGILPEEKEAIKRFVYRTDNRNFEGQRYLQIERTDKLNVSVVPISARIFYTFFSKPRQYCQTPPNSQYGLILQVLRRATAAKSRNLISLITSCDYDCYLSYVHFCDLFNLKPDAYDSMVFYADTFQDITSYYNSLMLRYQMMDFNPHRANEYFLSLDNSFVELGSNDRYVHYKHYVTNSDWIRSHYNPLEKSKCECYKLKYKKRLLPKHFNYCS